MSLRFIVGPTGSGKSSLAETFNGIIVNADSQQLYKSLSIMRATPPHASNKYLYSILDDEQSFNACTWAENVSKLISTHDEITIVGGTILYVRTLIEGIPPTPIISDQVKAKVAEIINLEKFVLSVDPEFRFRDPYRLERAAGVYLETGISITEHQKKPRKALLHRKFDFICTSRPAKCDLVKRIHQMIRDGALDQVKELQVIPQVRPIGLDATYEYLKDHISYDQMVELWANQMSQYAKRQQTYTANFKRFVDTLDRV